MKWKLWLLAGAGVAATVPAVWLAARHAGDRPTQAGAALTLVVGISLLGCGLASWRARPENRLGAVMVATGFAWLAAQLAKSSTPALYTAGTAVQLVFIVGFIYLLVTFPSGRPGGRLDRIFVWSAVALAVGLQVGSMLFGSRSGLRCDGCPANLLRVADADRAALGLLDLQRLLGGILTVSLIAVLVRRWLRASPPQRRAVLPVLAAGCLTLTALTCTVAGDLLGDPLGSLPANAFYYSFATIPIALLVVLAQRHLDRGVVAGLVVSLGQPSGADLRQALSDALRDPSLELAFWLPAEGRYVAGDGRQVELPPPGDVRHATLVERDGQPIAALLHDPALEHNADLVRSVCAAAGLALENERLAAELRARLVELQASRARLVEATDAERRRIERDLHDGTQQRLVSLAMSLGLLESRLADAGSARPLLSESRAALASALAELRELTHGIRPPLLVERGLPAALDELCRRAALPATLETDVPVRLPDRVESAAYFLVSEALTNAAKHSHGSELRVRAVSDRGRLRLEVRDDGIGGASPAGGSGLRGLADRIEALGGRFTVSSPPGRGTTIDAEIPCG
jgi:signal transduction histidine kinase